MKLEPLTQKFSKASTRLRKNLAAFKNQVNQFRRLNSFQIVTCSHPYRVSVVSGDYLVSVVSNRLKGVGVPALTETVAAP